MYHPRLPQVIQYILSATFNASLQRYGRDTTSATRRGGLWQKRTIFSQGPSKASLLATQKNPPTRKRVFLKLQPDTSLHARTQGQRLGSGFMPPTLNHLRPASLANGRLAALESKQVCAPAAILQRSSERTTRGNKTEHAMESLSQFRVGHPYLAQQQRLKSAGCATIFFFFKKRMNAEPVISAPPCEPTRTKWRTSKFSFTINMRLLGEVATLRVPLRHSANRTLRALPNF